MRTPMTFLYRIIPKFAMAFLVVLSYPLQVVLVVLEEVGALRVCWFLV